MDEEPILTRCNCGAYPPADALFCHKCGRPLRELLEPEAPAEIETPPPLPEPVAQIVPPPPRIGFQNGQAVRIALLAGALSIIIFAIGGQVAPPAFAPVWMVAGGMLAAVLYKVRTGQKLTPIGGARLGWLSGIFGFVILSIFLAMFVTMLIKDPSSLTKIKEQSAELGRPAPDFDKMLDELRHPVNVLLFMPLSFLLFTILSAFGGALGARLLDRD